MGRLGAAALLLAASTLAEAAGPIALEGAVERPAAFTLDQLEALPALTVQAAREGGASVRYAGPALWPLLEAAHPIDGPARGSHLQHVVLARGADGYAVALAMGEIDPRFEGKTVIIALSMDGVRLPAPRLVVPGDRAAGRNVRELVALELR